MSEKYEVKNGSFSLFKNENRTEENKQPHYNGNGKDLNGVEFQVSAWLTTSKSGMKYLSCKMQEPYEKKQEGNNSSNDDLGLDF
jgi:uncharacterized protein (DUF736 family)|tara:strand:+ start:4849 stop:5100 length:252 start_codon:yes stop_codon:yes gene_type:complete